MWAQVKQFETKGKTNKTIKVVVSDLIAIREKISEFKHNLSNAQNKIAELSENQSSTPQNILQSSSSPSSGMTPIYNINTSEIKKREEAINQKEIDLKNREEAMMAKEIMMQTNSQQVLGDLEKKIENREEMYLQLQQQLGQLQQTISQKDQFIEKLNQQMASADAIKSLTEMGSEFGDVDNSEELISRDAEISKLQGIINDFESKDGLKNLGSLETQLKEMTKDAQAQSEILDFKSQELVAAQSLIETQKAELAQAMIELGEERKRMDKEIELQKAMMSSEIDMQKSAMNTEIESVNHTLQDNLDLKDQEIARLNALIQQQTTQINQASISQNAEKDNLITQLQSSLKQAEGIYHANQAKLKELTAGNQNLQQHINKLQENVISPEKYNQLLKRLQETESNYATLNQNYESVTLKYKQMSEIIVEKDCQIKSLDQAHAVMSPSLSSSNITPSSPTFTASVASSTPSEPKSVFTPSPMSSSVPSSLPATSSRVVCPKCNSTKLKIVEDKSTIITYVPSVVYAKKNLCSQCGHQF